MHDPMIVAHEIKYPWYLYHPWPRRFRRDPNTIALRRRWKEMEGHGLDEGRDQHWPEGYRETFITIWHVDPEKDGSDDSCGWAWPKLTKKQVEILRNASWHEGHSPHFLCCKDKVWQGTNAEAESLFRGMVLLIDRVLHLHLSWAQISQFAAERTHILDVGKAGNYFCFLPGYHTNSQTDSEREREDHFHGMMCGVARGLLDLKRPWYRHPKWHFWHWKFQCHPLVSLKRWAFSRCCKCGKGFKWGYSPVTGSWHGTGPLWFRSERNTYHSDCNSPGDPCVAAEIKQPEPASNRN